MVTGVPPFERFYETHQVEVLAFLRRRAGRDRADDLFQETFLRALRAYGRLEHGEHLRAWVLTIAHRKTLDAHRARARRALPVADVAEHDTRGTAPASTAGVRDERLWSAVGALPNRQRSAVVLRFLADLPHREIARAIGCSEEAARRSLHEGLSKLREAVPA